MILRRLFLLACGVLLGGAGVLAQDPAAGPPEIFERTAAGVRVRRETLGLSPGRPVRLNVRPDAAPRDAVITSAADTALGSHLLRGRLKDTPGGSFLVAAHGSAVAASVWVSPSERYTLDGATLRAEPLSSQVRCACAADPARPAPAFLRAPVRDAAPAATTGPLGFDVLVVYTPAALAAEGSVDAITAQAELAMADANACYENSGVPIIGRIVSVRPVAYSESGEIRTDLHRLATPGDGFLDEVQAMRDETEADLVCLFTNRDSADGYNGYAEILTGLTPDYETLGFSVVNVKRAAVDHLFAHELGHNMGCDHDRENTAGLRLTDYSYGWRFTGTDGVLYHDVMAYPPGASIAFFGTPLVSYAGVPTGVADYADTARTLRLSAPTFINFRAADGRARVSVAAAANTDDVRAAQFYFEFERTGSTAAPLTVSYVTGGTAAAGKTYRALPGSVTFAAGDHFATQNVRVKKSAAPFGESAVTLTLSPSDGYVPAADPANVGSGPTATVPLYDRLPLVNLLPRAKATADGGHVKFIVYRLGHFEDGLGIHYTLGGTAVAGVDYAAPTGQITFAPGRLKAVIKVRLLTPAAMPPTGGRTLEVHLVPDAASYNVAAPGSSVFSW